jgi:Rrf2 family protein
LATQEPNRLVPSHIIARAQGIPEQFLFKALLPLAGVGILASLRGPNGGYRLARAPKAVNMLEVIEAIDGPLRGEAPLSREASAGPCDRRLDAVCQEAAAKVRRHLASIRLADLLDNKKSR